MSNSGLQMVMHTGGRVVLSANKAGQIRNLLNQYIVESNSGTYDYVKALAAFSSRDEGALSFKKGEVIAVVPKHDAYTEKVTHLTNSNFFNSSDIRLSYVYHKYLRDQHMFAILGLVIWHQGW